MPTRIPIKKPAAPAGKPAKPFNPIIVRRTTAMVFPTEMLAFEINHFPVTTLKEMLRSRGLPIPKDKDLMVDRLVTWAVRDGGTFVLSLH